MKIIRIQPKEIHVTIELSLAQIRQIVDFNEKAMSLYVKVYEDANLSVLDYVRNDYTNVLKQVLKEIDHGA